MLGNYAHLGLIQLMFPRAAIIDARRHPMACGFSCYRQLFTRRLAFTYSLEEFARVYREYHDFVAQFDTVLPGRVHRVCYEQLIADPEAEVRRLLAHCGLEFEAGCLRFYENPRAVLTISSEQVRQPLYTDSLEQWRHYAPWLGPLTEGLRDLVERYPMAGRPESEPAGRRSPPDTLARRRRCASCGKRRRRRRRSASVLRARAGGCASCTSGNEVVGLLRTPAARQVLIRRRVEVQERVDNLPRRLHFILARKVRVSPMSAALIRTA
jgi:hypothetical protein